MSTPRDERTRELSRALVRFNARVLAGMSALACAAGLFVATWVLILQGGQGGESPGTMLGTLRHFFPGYAVTPLGALIGAFWGFVAGGLVGWVFGRAYGPGLLRQTARRRVAIGDTEEPGSNVALVSPTLAGLVTGAMLAGGLFLATNWLLLRYEYPSPHLELLSHYLPGYTTSFLGSLAGAAGLFVYGFVFAACSAWIYNRIAILRNPHPLA